MTLAHIVLHGWDWFFFAMSVIGVFMMGVSVGRGSR